LHCIGEISSSDLPSEIHSEGRYIIPLHSRILLKSLNMNSRAVSVTSLALSDAFTIARISCGRDPGGGAASNRHISISFPNWFPWDGSHPDIRRVSPPIYMFCAENVMELMDKLGTTTLADIYGEFFNYLFHLGHSRGKVAGKMEYLPLTPEWLRKKILFVHGRNRNKSITFGEKVLPRKNFIRKKGKRSLGCAILTQWIKRKEWGYTYLKSLFLKRGATIPEEYEDSNLDDPVIDMTATSRAESPQQN